MEPSVESLYFPALTQGISKDWAEGHFADLEVIVEGQKFKCHRIILAAMSQYFSTMFTSGKSKYNTCTYMYLYEGDSSIII